LANEVGQELRAGVALVDVVFGEYLIGEIGAGFEGELLGQDEGIVTVEEQVGNLVRRSVNGSNGGQGRALDDSP